MNTPYGVSIQLFNIGLEITPTPQGYLGAFNLGDEIEMRITMSNCQNGHRIAISSDRDRKNVKRLAECFSTESKTFSHLVPIIMSPGGRFACDDVNENCVHIVDMDNTGLVTVTNIVISGQDGEFFLVVRETYRVQTYKDSEGRIAVPQLWVEPTFSELVPFVVKNYATFGTKLPNISTYVETTNEPDQSILDALPDNNHMVVTVWSIRSKTGRGIRKDGEPCKLYYRNINVADRFPKHLLVGETISATGFRPFQSKFKSSMKVEATGITRVEFEQDAKS